LPFLLEDEFSRCGQVRRGEISGGFFFLLPHEDGDSPCCLSSLDVHLAVAHHETLGQVNFVFPGELQQEAGLRLAAAASGPGPVRTGGDIVDDAAFPGYFFPQFLVHRIQLLSGHVSQRNAALVGDHEHFEACIVQPFDRCRCSGQHFQFCGRVGRAPAEGFVEDTIAIEEHCSLLIHGLTTFCFSLPPCFS